MLTSWWSFNERTMPAGNLPLYKAYGWTAFLAAVAGASLISALTLLFGAGLACHNRVLWCATVIVAGAAGVVAFWIFVLWPWVLMTY